MDLDFDPVLLGDLLLAEAEVHGLTGRLRTLTALRESDGLDTSEALVDAAESIGLLGDVRARLDAALEPLAALEIATVKLVDVHGGMPTFRREDAHAELAVPPGPAAEVSGIIERLVARAVEDPARTAVVLPLGLGGTGGCACGDELPEDAPSGPLFDRR